MAYHNGLCIREMLLGAPGQLRDVQRFSTFSVLRKESVAEHSFYTAFYAMMIARAMTSNSHTLASEDERFVGACVQRALVHDLEEARSGDFPRPFKYSDPKLKEVLDNLGGVAFGQCFIKVLQDFTARTSLEKLWREAKDDTPEGHVVKFADFLSAFVFIYMESHNGNKRFRSQIGSEINLYSELFRADPYRDMAPWVDEVQEMLKEIE